MESPRRVVRRTEERGKQYPSNSWTTKLSLMEDKPLGMELRNSSDAHGETDSEQEIPLASFDDFPSISREFEYKKMMVIRHGKFNTKTQKQMKEARKQHADTGIPLRMK